MELRRISIDSKAIILKVVANNEPDDSSKDLVESKVTAHEIPLPSFTKAFDALPAVFCEIMETGSDWAAGLKIDGITISRTKHGTRSVILSGTKQLEVRSEFLHPVATPMVLIDKLQDGESGSVQLEKKLCEKIARAILEAEKYMEGDRSQALLNFDESKAALNALADKGREKDSDMFAAAANP